MTEFTLSYREVIPDQSSTENWNDITLTTGTQKSYLYEVILLPFNFRWYTKYPTRHKGARTSEWVLLR